MAALTAGCERPLAEPAETAWAPTRADYAEFRARHPGLPEPNYLPFMAHRLSLRGQADDVVILCRWEAADFPLRVHIVEPEIPDTLQSEFDPREPSEYVAAVEAALESWAEALPDTLSFERVPSAGTAQLTIRLRGEEGPSPDPEVQVLGTTPVARACQLEDGPTDGDRLPVRFRVPELDLFLADRFGLLPPDQVERLALHELGHALGMRGHSPIPADLMYEQARDRTVSELSLQDRRSFAALYSLPNGTVYMRIARGVVPKRPEPRPPEGPVALDPEPFEDGPHGFRIRLPRGWLRVPTRQGVVVVDGVTWDYEASIQVIVRRYRTLDEYLSRHLGAHIGRGNVVAQGTRTVAGRPAFHMRVEQGDGMLVEEHTFVESGDGRVAVILAEAPGELYGAFAPWFEAVRTSLEWTNPAAVPPPAGEGS